MNCPSCNQPASTFLRYTFSLQGVSLAKSIQGYFKCRNCGATLRVTSFGRHFWTFLIVTFVVLGLFAFFYQRLLSVAGTGPTAVVWMAIVLLVLLTFTFGVWKYAHAEVSENHHPIQQ